MTIEKAGDSKPNQYNTNGPNPEDAVGATEKKIPKKEDFPTNQGTLQSRKTKKRPALKLKIEPQSPKNLKIESDPIIDEINLKISRSPISEECEITKRADHILYRISGNGVELYAHPIVKTSVGVDSFWSEIKLKKISRVVSLQEPGWNSSYLPEPEEVGKKKTLTDDKDGTTINIKILGITQLTEIKPGDEKLKSLQLEISNSEGEYIQSVQVDQIFNWPDHGVIPLDQAKVMVARLPDKDCQIHCRAGLGRTGTLIVMKQLSMDPDLTNENMIDKIADCIARGRAQRGDGQFVQTNEQIQLIVDFVTDELKNRNE